MFDLEYNNIEYWKELALYDIVTAEAMLKTKRYLYVGFMCHQAIEKILKAYFLAHCPEEQLPYIHALDRLADKSGILEEMSPDQEKLIARLGPLNIESRYPSSREKLLKGFTEAACTSILSETKELLEWIISKL